MDPDGMGGAGFPPPLANTSSPSSTTSNPTGAVDSTHPVPVILRISPTNAGDRAGYICWSPNWNEPRIAMGTPQFGILANPYPNRFGDPRSNTQRRIRGSGGGAGVAACGGGSISRSSGSSGSGSASIFGEKTPILCVTEKKTKKSNPNIGMGICRS